MRVLGIDIGARRIGVAISDELGFTAQPLPTIDRKQVRSGVKAVAAIVAEHGAERVVYGLPLNMNGSEGPAAVNAREFAAALAELVDVPLIPCDERLTTVEAEQVLRETGVSRKKRRSKVDQIAAQIILQGWLDARAAEQAREEEEGQ